MKCSDCDGIGEIINPSDPGQPCFFCNGTGELCDHCGEAIDVCDGLCDGAIEEEENA